MTAARNPARPARYSLSWWLLRVFGVFAASATASLAMALALLIRFGPDWVPLGTTSGNILLAFCTLAVVSASLYIALGYRKGKRSRR